MFKYKRVLVKISGEALGRENGRELDHTKLEMVAKQLVKLSSEGAEIAVVVGAGNFWRGKYGADYMERTNSDYMGMLATVLNALALQDMIESLGAYTRVMTAIEMKAVAEPYIRRKAIKHLTKKRIVIFACGTGNPYFTTDTAAALRAVESECECILLAKNVDGVYDKDPKKHSDAKKYDEVTYMQVIADKLAVMDATAITLCMENNMPIVVFPLMEENSIIKAINGEKFGTVIER